MIGTPTLPDRMISAIASGIVALPVSVMKAWNRERLRMEVTRKIVGSHIVPVEVKPIPVPEPSHETTGVIADNVVSWVVEYKARHGTKPPIKAVQEKFGLPHTTAWRRIQKAV